jgi:lipopolysaccharide/colanic/teichoic acid biosynthesis glycosyltransferase
VKRIVDLLFSVAALIVSSPVMITAIVAVWLYDRHSPFYRATRAGYRNRDFMMLKIRSMRVDADKIGGSSTSGRDPRITPVGHYVRRFKLDELSQFWNVLMGDMSVVGPRPNTRRDGVDLYTEEEMRLLSVKPGVTDISSIVFSDEGNILAESDDPDGHYNRVIRPWKSRLGLLYIEHQSLMLDLRVIWLTGVALVSKPKALSGVTTILKNIGADARLIEICRRQTALPEGLPPGARTA